MTSAPGHAPELRAVVPESPSWLPLVVAALAALGVNLSIGDRLPAGVRLAFAVVVVAAAIPVAFLLRRGLREMSLTNDGGAIVFRDMRGRVHRFDRSDMGAVRSLNVRGTATVPRLYVLDRGGRPLLRLDRRQWRMPELLDFFGVAHIDDSKHRVSVAALRRDDRRYAGFAEAHMAGLVVIGTLAVIFAGTAVVVALQGR